MPLLFALGQHKSLVEAQARLRGNEIVLAYLDDVYAACGPLRVASVHTSVEEELFTYANIRVHHGKTQVWKRGGVMPEGIEELTQAARWVKPDAVVWKGDPELPHAQQGLKVLGVPIGQPEYVRDFLEKKSREQEVLFNKIPGINDPQAAWLLLLMCASTRSNFWLRGVRPEQTEAFADCHDVEACLRRILGIGEIPVASQVLSTLALSSGGLGLTSANRSRFAAHWASWADCVRMVKERHPPIADMMIHHLQEGLAPSFLSVRACARRLVEAGLDMVSWDELSRAPPTLQEDPEPNQPKVGWQQKATRKLEERFIRDEVWPALDDTQRALLRSQHGLLASSPFTALPTSRVTRMDAQPFRRPYVPTLALAPSSVSSYLPMWPPT